MAPTSTSTGIFYFWQDDPATGGLIARGQNPVTAVAPPGLIAPGMWDDILDPAVEQPTTGKWPLSAANQRDYHTELWYTAGHNLIRSNQKVNP